jgi:RNA polymerase sigma-70 factor, ECF subfamily
VADVDTVERVIDRDGDRLYRLAMRIAGSNDDAEEALEAALGTVVSAPPAHDDEPPFARIYRAVARAAHEKRRAREPHAREITLAAVVPVLDIEGRHFEPMDDWSTRIDAYTLDDRFRDVLMDAIDALPTDDRTALILCDLEDASTAEIAAILDTDVPTVKRRVHRARLFVRKWLSEYFESAGVP